MAFNPVFLSIRALSELIRSRQMSPVELTQIFLNRLEEMGPRYNAVVTLTRDLALQQARQAEKDIASGNYRGPLHGVPYGAKDLLATSGGVPTTWGAACFRDRLFDYDARVICRLKEAGAILAAKLAMVEFAGGMGYRQPNATFTGPGVNPWDTETWSGGSSSGSGSAVCAGLVPFAIGSETWGSILGPANHCGVAGLRPTYGRVSRYGAMTLCWTLDKLGPLCLTADDCGLVLEAIAGADPLDPTTSDRVFRYDPAPLNRRFKLGVIRNVADGVSDPMRRNFETALQNLAEIATFEEVTLPEMPYDEITRTILFAEASSAHEDFIERGETARLTAPEDRYTPYTRMVVLARDYIRALRLREFVCRKIDAVMSQFDALIGPSRPTTATKLDSELPSPLRGSAKDTMGAIGNLAGLPAISVPSGFSPTGLPTGIQFMGRAYEENAVLAVAHAYQSRTEWHLRHPPETLPPDNDPFHLR
jgi:aspartyl-tRNA(Asn)/glutamyl-tRNA(Gln) amidotransferase subunit A